MSSTLNSSVLDDGLDQGLQNIAVAGNVDCHVCSAVPTTYAEATTTYSLGSVVAIGITGPVAGGTGGRLVTVDAVVDANVVADGTALFVALVDTNTSTLLATQSLSSGAAVLDGELWSANAWDIEISDPS